MFDPTLVIDDLHRQYARYVYAKCVRILGDPHEAEDAVQDTFLNAYRWMAKQRKSHPSPLAWLYCIATNASLKILRTRRRKGTAGLEEPDQVPGRNEDPVQAMAMRRALETLADELDERSLQIVVAHFVDGMPQGDIAKALAISRRAVVKRLARVRDRVAQLLEVEDETP